MLSIASGPRKTASLAALYNVELECFTLPPSFVALNTMPAFSQTPIRVEVGMTTLARLGELGARWEISTFNANNEAGQPMLARSAATSASWSNPNAPEGLLSARPCMAVDAKGAELPLARVEPVDCFHRQELLVVVPGACQPPGFHFSDRSPVPWPPGA